MISLVSFPDEVFALPVSASSSNAKLLWEVDGTAVPPVGTPVVLRIRPVETPARDDAHAADGGGE